MPYFEISEEAYNSLDDSVKSQFTSYTPEDTSGLKEKANQLLSEKKAEAAKTAEALAEVARLQADLKKGKIPEDNAKLEDALAKLTAAEERASALEKSIVDGKINAEAQKIGATLAPSDARRAAFIAKEVKSRLQLEGESITVLSKDGKPTISTLDELMGEFRSEYDFLVDGSKASGGGASGGNGGGATKSAKTIPYSEYKNLSARDKGALQEKGVQVVED